VTGPGLGVDGEFGPGLAAVPVLQVEVRVGRPELQRAARAMAKAGLSQFGYSFYCIIVYLKCK
jgi:hypothetical protein